MPLSDILRAELIDIIEWDTQQSTTLAYRFNRSKNEIKNGAQLIVRPGQAAVFVDQGKIADTFEPGRYTLKTSNLPLLSTLQGWKYGFESPFKAEVIFVATTQMVNYKWGTQTPVLMRDTEMGTIRVRAFGTYTTQVGDPATLIQHLVGAAHDFDMDQLDAQLRDFVVAAFSQSVATLKIAVADLSSQYTQLGASILAAVRENFATYGLIPTKVIVENVSLPDEVQNALDRKASMNVIGNLNDYTKLAAADAMRDAATNPNGNASSGIALGAGVAMGQAVVSALPSAAPVPAATTGPTVPPPLPVEYYVAINGQQQGPLSLSDAQQLIAHAPPSQSVLVWSAGMTAWAVPSTVPVFRGLVPPPLPAV